MRMTSEFIIVPIKDIHKFDTLRSLDVIWYFMKDI